MKMLRLGTIWCAGLAALLPAPWAILYGILAGVGAVAWFTGGRSRVDPGPAENGGPAIDAGRTR